MCLCVFPGVQRWSIVWFFQYGSPLVRFFARLLSGGEQTRKVLNKTSGNTPKSLPKVFGNESFFRVVFWMFFVSFIFAQFWSPKPTPEMVKQNHFLCFGASEGKKVRRLSEQVRHLSNKLLTNAKTLVSPR